MPLYSYVCSKCKKEFEELVSTGNSALVTCPNCDSREIERKFSGKIYGKVSSSAPSCGNGGFT
ncbi:zinc ribbon domain-containing protein [Microaerobacter geothermalis]|uniref:FmdB family zinc ribbon protein n=1 Tax=Microaerobacter geothermalis TaxID=674972 RepID=UPI001F1EEF4D|nr:zinc ribbon domain-containing protein [Microaerobacter geothermalis]MCF6094240.1 zinc ribbon domain-containing protein [Microaerobacter geothermalis]